jgi:hypothetical protein
MGESATEDPGYDDDEITEFRPQGHLRRVCRRRCDAEIGESAGKVNENDRLCLAGRKKARGMPESLADTTTYGGL